MEKSPNPYFSGRREKAKNHRVMRTIGIDSPCFEVRPNKELANPAIEGSIREIGWSERAVSNIIDASQRGLIKIRSIGQDRMAIELLPLAELPESLGHVSELESIKRNLARQDGIFGSERQDKYSYLQTVDFAVEGYLDDETDGKLYGRVYVKTERLKTKRNIYLDPESLYETDHEYGFAFCVIGGIPLEAISRIEVIQAKRLEPVERVSDLDDSEWTGDAEKHMKECEERLRKYVNGNHW